MELTHCPVCGFGPFEIPYPSVRDCGASFDFCECCFCQYGFDDSCWHLDRWISEGASWECAHDPRGCDLAEQLGNAIEGWRGTVRGFARDPGFEERFGPDINRFLDWATDPIPKRRLSAVMVIACLEDERIEPALRSMIDDEDEDIRWLSELAVQGRAEYRRHGLR